MAVKVIIVTFFVFATVVYAFPPALIANGKLKNTYGPDITDGNCASTPDQDLVFTDHVHKTKIPFFKRSATSTYYGDKTIYCIRAINQKSADRGGNANVTEGGVGHSFATIEMESYVDHGIEFIINIYGK
ncbi:uncharacterized protein LOC115882644 [Sitophilus oryzae]|uniref:Uncharacterized protein LOC115882644 n=1 Tax=Sitophilus oryzae TaxID=7048 RepID=A0A6J2Y193_SITOR|nr:uncharacterized protein LOC115882644 [Sitophilus oryzae]